MSKLKFFIGLSVAMSVINLVLLAGLFFKKPPHHFHPDQPRDIVIERLSFDRKQVEEYKWLIQEHRMAIGQLDERIVDLKQNLYAQLVLEESKVKDSLISEIETCQRKVEEVHFNHFLDIKELCNPNQLEEYDELVKDLTSIFNHRHHKKKH